jgi:hypothetical protein
MSPVLPTPLDSGSNKYPWGYASKLVGGKSKTTTYKKKTSKKSRKMRKTRKAWDKSSKK